MQSDDGLIVTELSRLGRSLMDVMRVLHALMKQEVTVYAIEAGSTLGYTLNAKVVAFALSLAAEIERAMIAQRTKDALARKQRAGKRLGRPKGSLAKTTKLTGTDVVIKERLAKQISISAIA